MESQTLCAASQNPIAQKYVEQYNSLSVSSKKEIRRNFQAVFNCKTFKRLEKILCKETTPTPTERMWAMREIEHYFKNEFEVGYLAELPEPNSEVKTTAENVSELIKYREAQLQNLRNYRAQS